MIETLRPIPAIAWVPMSIMLWPSNEESVVFITFLGAFFPILINTLHGVASLDPVLIRAARSLGAGEWALLRDVYLPGAPPHIFTGLTVGMGVAWVSLIAAEMISGQFGIGYFTWEAYALVQYADIVLGMLLIGGGPEMFGGGVHVWSGQAARQTQVLHIRGAELRRLMERIPRLAVALVEALVSKGKAYSALIHMLGARSAAERLAQLLLLMAGLDGRRTAEGVVISRSLTQEDLAKMVGATRQWVTTTLDRFREQGFLTITPNKIVLIDEEALR